MNDKNFHAHISDHIRCDVCEDEKEVEAQLTHIVRTMPINGDGPIYTFHVDDDGEWEVLRCPFCQDEKNH